MSVAPTVYNDMGSVENKKILPSMAFQTAITVVVSS